MLPRIEECDEKLAKPIQFPLSTPEQRKNLQNVSGFKDYTGQDPTDIVPIAYKTNYEGRDMYFSKPYVYKGYPILFAFVETEGSKLVPRLLYHSSSRAQWRISPTLKGKFGKGYASDMDINLPPILSIVLTDKFKAGIEQPETLSTFPDIKGFVAAFTLPIVGGDEAASAFRAEVSLDMTGDRSITKYPAQAFEKKIREVTPLPAGMGFTPKKKKPVGVAKGISLGLKPEGKATMCLIDASTCPLKGDEAFLPDFKRGPLFKTKIQNPFYNHLLRNEHPESNGMTLLCFLSADEKYQYLIADCMKEDKPYRFVLTVSNNPCDLTSFLVPKDYINLGHKMVFPAVRAGELILKTGQMEVDRKSGECGVVTTPAGDRYMDVTPYAAQLPMNHFLTMQESLDFTPESDLDMSKI
jgi:hypothetical protein